MGFTLESLAGGGGQSFGDRAAFTLGAPWNLNSDMTLANQSASSSAGNRFACPSGADLVLAAEAAALLWYQSVESHWHVFAWS